MNAKDQNKANAVVLPNWSMTAHISCLAACLAVSLILHGCDDPLDPEASFLFVAQTTTPAPAPGGAPVSSLSLDTSSCDDTPAPINGHTTTCGNRWKWLRAEQGYSTAAAKCRVKKEEQVKCACLPCAQSTTPTPAPPTPCWKTLNGIAAQEGNDMGMVAMTLNVAACQRACDGNARCNSFSGCADYGQCWFKDKRFSGGESLDRPHGKCKTYYKSTCSGTSLVPTTSTVAPTTGVRTSTTMKDTCDESTWPDKDHGLVCGDCKVLVNNFDSSYQNCDGYCTTLGMDCAGAWEESSDTCIVDYEMTCNQKLSSSDALCQCKARSTTTTPVGNCDDSPAPIPGHPSTTCGSRWQWLRSERGYSTAAAKCKIKDEEQVKCACLPCTQAPATTTTPGVVPSCIGTPAPDPCNVPAGSCATIAGHKSCPGQTIVRGTLQIQSNSKLNTKKLHVHQGGKLIVGTSGSPVSNVEINLGRLGEIFSEGHTYIYGQPKTSWTTLSRECNRCRTIHVHACHGWQAGDEIVLVAILPGAQYGTDERTISSISGCQITLDRNAGRQFKSEMYKGRVPIRSEVLNMRRSVWIHGHNIVTRQHHTGFMQMHHARIYNCGKKELGAYCLHFHHVGSCPQCSFVGNAVGKRSENKGITIHGTSDTLVENNIVYDHRGAFLYVEDGNEIKNTIKGNALVCPKWTTRNDNGCSYNGIPEHDSSDKGPRGVTGLYAVSVNNDFIGNHIAGMGEAFFQDFQSSSKTWGGDAVSKNKACPQALPFRRVSDNYFHNNAHFGFYAPHSTYPTRVQTNSNGLVTNWESCLGFDPITGDDNSQGYTVNNHVELYQDFGAGGYDGGETSFVNSKFAFCNSGNYYKTFRRGIRTGPFCVGCFYTDDKHPMTSGGSCMWEFRDTVFEDIMEGLKVNHHCGNDGEWTGGLCASHVWFTGNSQWKGRYPFKLINDCQIGRNWCKQYTDVLVHLKGTTYFNTRAAHPAFRTNGCRTGQAGGEWTGCGGNIRIVRIYSANRGQLKVINNNEGYHRMVPYTPWTKSRGWARPNSYDKATKYQNGGMGYTFLVKAGQSYTLEVNGGPDNDFFTLEYSDEQMPRDEIYIEVRRAPVISGGRCTIRSNHKRNWITPYGPYVPQSGAWWDCKKWPVSYTIARYRNDQRSYLRSRGISIS